MHSLLLLTCELSVNNGSYAHRHMLSVPKPLNDMDTTHPQDVHVLCRSVSKPLKHMPRPCSQDVSTAMSVTSHFLVPTVYELVPRRGAPLIFRSPSHFNNLAYHLISSSYRSCRSTCKVHVLFRASVSAEVNPALWGCRVRICSKRPGSLPSFFARYC